MKIWKKWVTLLLTALCVISPFMQGLTLADGSAVTFSVSDMVAAQGEKISIPVEFSGNTGFAAVELSLTYQTDVLELAGNTIYDSVQKNFADAPINASEYRVESDDQTGLTTVYCMFIITNNVTKESGTIFTLLLRVRNTAAEATTSITLSVLEVANENGKTLTGAAESGRFTVRELLVTDETGAALTSVPQKSFTMDVPTCGGKSLTLAAYDENGKLLWVDVEQPTGDSQSYTVDNTKGTITKLSVFTCDSAFLPILLERTLGT